MVSAHNSETRTPVCRETCRMGVLGQPFEELAEIGLASADSKRAADLAV